MQPGEADDGADIALAEPIVAGSSRRQGHRTAEAAMTEESSAVEASVAEAASAEEAVIEEDFVVQANVTTEMPADAPAAAD